MRLPNLAIVLAINASIRHDDEWFDEPDEVERIVRLLNHLEGESDPVSAAAIAVERIARSQAFTDRNGEDGRRFIPEDDFTLANLLLSAARGNDESAEVVELFNSRR